MNKKVKHLRHLQIRKGRVDDAKGHGSGRGMLMSSGGGELISAAAVLAGDEFEKGVVASGSRGGRRARDRGGKSEYGGR